MTAAKGVLLAVGVATIAIQFIRPERNHSMTSHENDASRQSAIPGDVQSLIRNSCYDCHSNTTRYPWYAEVQPVGWWLAGHIREGKKELNFDEFDSYRPRRKFAKLGQIEEQIARVSMPLRSYTLIHTDAVLSPVQQSLIIAWSRAMRDSMKAVFPPDSLERRRQR